MNGLTEALPRDRKRELLLLKLRQSAGGRAADPMAAAIPRADRGGALPLSFAQQRLWFVDQLDHAAGAAYHMPVALRLRGRLDRAALQATLDRVVARHESLRTRFINDNGTPRQHIDDADWGLMLREHDLVALHPDEQAAAIAQISQCEVEQPFDLEHGPLIRGRLLRLGNDHHVLLLTQHHIITDGWSIGVLIQEVSTLYAAFHSGADDPLPPMTLQYADYAVWQRDWLHGDVLANQTAFWKSYLTGAPALLSLPHDRPRPAVQSYAGGNVETTIPQQLAARLRELSHRHGATLFMTLLTGWSILLARLSGQDDVVVGTPVANRSRRELEGLIGFFANTLALRLSLTPSMSVSEGLAVAKRATLAAYDHQLLPFDQVVEALQPQRSLSHSPLFQVMLSMTNTPVANTLELPGLQLSAIEQPQSSAQFDLSLSFTDSGDDIVGSLQYASDLFDRSSVEEIGQRLIHVLTAMADDDAQPIGRLPLMGAEERRDILQRFDAAPVASTDDMLIHARFERQAAETPDAVAVEYDGQQLRYAELNARANQLAHRLRAAGVGPDCLVGLCAERSLEMLVGVLGILKAGGAYVPLDPGYPPARLAFLLEDASPVVLLVDGTGAGLLADADVPVLRLDDDALHVGQSLHNPVVPGLSPAHLAYVIYTSGSTGQPKGVLVEHRSVINLWQTLSRDVYADVSGAGRIGLNAGLSFDASVQALTQLLSGRCVVIVPQDVRRDSAAFARFVHERQLEAVDCTPAQLTQLFEVDPTWQPPSLRMLLIGGEAIPSALWSRLAALDGVVCWNVYGPTECTVDSTGTRIEGAQPHIGRPLSNVSVRILDAFGEPVPMGVCGELYIGGVQVARGYWRRDALTAERFIADPFSNMPGARLYRTGDLGRWRRDGSIEYLGRNDQQVKIRGFRIEPGEIEAQLCRLSGVREAAVLVRDDAPGEPRLVAYVVCAGDVADAAALRRQLAMHLPEPMLPSAFVPLERLPLTANGKLDRAALPAPGGTTAAQVAYVAPVGVTESSIAAVWQSLLGIERVGRNDHFFELGGHSLLAVKLISQLRETLGVDLSLRQLFAQPVLADFAVVASQARRSALAPITPVDRSAALPLSHAQQRMWFVNRLDSASGRAYHMPIALRIDGVLDRTALQATLDRIVARHEGLRTTFVDVDGNPSQRIDRADCGFTLLQHDLSGLQSDMQSTVLHRVMESEITAPFDLAEGPLIRGRLLCLGEREHVLLITQHHIITDGWSINLLMQEVSALYQAFSSGQPDPLPPLALQYADYAAWQRSWLQGEELQAQTDFWKRYLQDVPTLLNLPTDRPRPLKRNYEGASIGATLSPELTARLKALSQRHGTTLFMSMLAGWSVLLARISGQNDLVIGTPVANRQRKDLEPLIGFFVNTLALRITLDGDPTLSELLTTIRRDTLQAFEHQDLPFEQVVEVVQPVRSMSHSPLFQVILNWETTQDDSRLSMPGLEMRSLDQSHSTTPYDLTLFLKDVGDRILCSWRYTTDLFDASTIERLIGQFECLLGDMVANESTPVSRLSLLDEMQREQVVATFNRTATQDRHDVTLHAQFERQAALRPDATAVVAEDGELTFDQLNRRANQVAHALLQRGVKPDQIVGLCVERSVDMLVGLFGILKAGAAYLPLDPGLPLDRIAHMLRDSGAVAVLAQPRTASSLPDASIQRLLLGADSVDLRGQPVGNPEAVGVRARNLAYVIYTSGSTGSAKGVMVEHRSPVNFWRAMERTTHRPCSAHGRVALNASFSFDMSLKGILQLLSGRCLVLIPQMIRADGAAMMRFLATHRIEAFDCTPSQLSVLISAGLLDSSNYRPRSVLIGGEPIAPDMWRRLKDADGIHFYNMYGPTECTVDATIGALDDLGEQPSIGWPIDNLRVLVLDGHGEPVPIGVAGELHLGGLGVARGYLNRPELTEERFVPDRFDSTPGSRLYRSGDLGRWRADGSIEYLGRNDFQVKIRGYRIELGEIEAALKACDGVRDAAVIAREDQPGDKRLVAYLTTSADAPLDIASLRTRLSSQLADYMLPSAFVSLPALPLNSNGKLDRHALPAPDASAVASQAFAAPSGEWETAVAALWQELLELDRVGRDDNFFDIGGHSLLGVLLLSRLRQQFDLEVPLRELFVHPTLREFAAAIATDTTRSGFRNLVPIRPQGSELPLFLVHPSEGEVGYARTLADALDEAVPVYGLAASGLAEGETPLTSIEEMATQYLREIRQVQPEGPYRIAGWSAGGIIAYEIVHQLIGADQAVEFLGLIDTAGDYRALHALRTGVAPQADVERNFDAWICSLDWLPLEHAPALRPQLETLAGAGEVESLLAHAQRLGELPAELDPALLRRHLALRHAMGDALLSYVRPPLPIAFTLFTAIDEDRRQRPIGWAHNVAHRRIDVPGTHFSVVQPPQVHLLADALTGELRRCSGRAPVLDEIQYSPMITIQSGRPDVRPMFCVPGAGASVAAFAGLAQAMDARIPIYGLQPRGLCGQLVPHFDVHSTVRAYLQAIRSVAPRGPYRLLGHSYGGWVAAEMARQLEAEGEQVETLVVLDSMPPPTPDAPLRRLSRLEVLERLIEIYELGLQRPLGLRASDLAPLSPDEQLALLLARLIDARVMHRGADIETMRGIVQVFSTNINTPYMPDGPYAGTLHLVKAPESPAGTRTAGALQDVIRFDHDHQCDWHGFAADTRCWMAPGNHMTMLSAPHVDRLAGWLQPLLGGVQ